MSHRSDFIVIEFLVAVLDLGKLIIFLFSPEASGLFDVFKPHRLLSLDLRYILVDF